MGPRRHHPTGPEVPAATLDTSALPRPATLAPPLEILVLPLGNSHTHTHTPPPPLPSSALPLNTGPFLPLE